MRAPERAAREGDEVRSFNDATQVVVDDVVTIYTDGWRAAVGEHTAGAAHEAISQELDQWDGSIAAAFDAVADGLDALRGIARQGVGELARAVARSVGLPDWAAGVAGRIVVSVTKLPFDAPLQAGALALRLVGAALQSELDALEHPAPATDITEPKEAQRLAESIERQLPSLVLEPARRPAPDLSPILSDDQSPNQAHPVAALAPSAIPPPDEHPDDLLNRPTDPPWDLDEHEAPALHPGDEDPALHPGDEDPALHPGDEDPVVHPGDEDPVVHPGDEDFELDLP